MIDVQPGDFIDTAESLEKIAVNTFEPIAEAVFSESDVYLVLKSGTVSLKQNISSGNINACSFLVMREI